MVSPRSPWRGGGGGEQGTFGLEFFGGDFEGEGEYFVEPDGGMDAAGGFEETLYARELLLESYGFVFATGPEHRHSFSHFGLTDLTPPGRVDSTRTAMRET